MNIVLSIFKEGKRVDIRDCDLQELCDFFKVDISVASPYGLFTREDPDNGTYTLGNLTLRLETFQETCAYCGPMEDQEIEACRRCGLTLKH